MNKQLVEDVAVQLSPAFVPNCAGGDCDCTLTRRRAENAIRVVTEACAKEIDDLARVWRGSHDPSVDSAYRNAAAAIRALAQDDTP